MVGVLPTDDGALTGGSGALRLAALSTAVGLVGCACVELDRMSSRVYRYAAVAAFINMSDVAGSIRFLTSVWAGGSAGLLALTPDVKLYGAGGLGLREIRRGLGAGTGRVGTCGLSCTP